MSNAPQTTETDTAADRCREAMERTYLDIVAAYDKNEESEAACKSRAVEAAARAYRTAMPALSSQENIRDFIACVAQGILLDVFAGADSSRLLYAAQVANSATQGRASKSKAA